MMYSLTILLHQESFIMAISDNGNVIITGNGRNFGKSLQMQRAMFETKERIAIVAHDGSIRYSEWADAEEIK